MGININMARKKKTETEIKSTTENVVVEEVKRKKYQISKEYYANN